jgi:hypothetical protein
MTSFQAVTGDDAFASASPMGPSRRALAVAVATLVLAAIDGAAGKVRCVGQLGTGCFLL